MNPTYATDLLCVLNYEPKSTHTDLLYFLNYKLRHTHTDLLCFLNYETNPRTRICCFSKYQPQRICCVLQIMNPTYAHRFAVFLKYELQYTHTGLLSFVNYKPQHTHMDLLCFVNYEPEHTHMDGLCFGYALLILSVFSGFTRSVFLYFPWIFTGLWAALLCHWLKPFSRDQWPLLLTWFNFNPSMDK